MACLSLLPPEGSITDTVHSHGLPAAARIRRRTFLSDLVALATLPWSAGVRAEQTPAATIPSERRLHAITRGDSAYERKRQGTVWQALKPDRRPALIVEARSDQDVIRTLQHARAENRQVSVRAGGHSYIASFLSDDTILLDVSALQEFNIARDKRSLSIGPGVRGAALDAHLTQHDLAFPVPHVGSVGMGGYLLGGGMGWNGESWGGMACFNILAIELITAAGRRLTVRPDSHPDLFWAARGAGPAFSAVATRFQLEAFARPQVIVRSLRVFPIDSVAIITRWLQHAAAAPHANVELTMILISDEQAETNADTPLSPSCLVSVACFADSRADANARLDEVARMAPPGPGASGDERRELTLAELLSMNNTGAPRRIAADNAWTHRPTEALTVLAGHYAQAPSPDTVVIANFRSAHAPPQNAACAIMAPCYMMWLASWDQPVDDMQNLKWVDAAARLAEPYTAGCYINETDFFSRPERAQRSYSADNWRRLHAVKTEYDPQNLFHAPF